VTGWEDSQLFDVPTGVPAVPQVGPVELDPVDEARAAVTFSGGDGAGLLRADALRLPLADNSVDLLVTSPPYFALRSYQDGDEHYSGQIGSEPTPQAFLEALWAVTAEFMRVLKPSGSAFINLGDKYAGSGGHNNSAIGGTGRGPSSYNKASSGVPAKSLMLLPEAYRLGCNGMLHALGGPPPPAGGPFIARAVICWAKVNGLPESVTDRVRRSHEDWVHLTKQPRYYAAVDNIREAHASAEGNSGWAKQLRKGETFGEAAHKAAGRSYSTKDDAPLRERGRGPTTMGQNPLGKLPGSVWEVATEPLRVPDWVGVDHFAAFPTEWPRRLILGWSPSGVCTSCGEGRRPVVEKEYSATSKTRGTQKYGVGDHNATASNGWTEKPSLTLSSTITGEACACPTPDAPTRPAVVLDPFGGTGTTAMVARSLGRFGVSVDLSADYLRLARWRIWQSGHSAKAVSRTWKERQTGLFDDVA
jgi:hypothetical protein